MAKQCKLAGLFFAIQAIVATGCWQEVAYTGPEPASSSDASPLSNTPLKEEKEEEVLENLPPAETDLKENVAEDDLLEDLFPPEQTAGKLPKTVDTEAPEAPEAPEASAYGSHSDIFTRRAAWLLGSKLSLASLASGQGVSEEERHAWFDQAKILADKLETTLDAMPVATDSLTASGLSDATMEYLFPLGRRIGKHLAGQFGADHAALFEVAFKTNMLLVLYHPDASVVDAVAAALTSAGPRSKLPSHLWQPLLEVLAQRPAEEVMKKAIFRLHEEVDAYLALVP